MRIIYISNSCLDGFNEGDGDLMDKIMIQLQVIASSTEGAANIFVKRIIVNSLNIPRNRESDVNIIALAPKEGEIDLALLARFESGNLSSEENQTFIEHLQKRFLDILDTDKAESKVLYIGSRFDAASPFLQGSGSLFTQSFLKKLKTRGIKIVICCLEYKFFKRSLSDLKKACEMFRQQLLLADKIQFLTESDKIDFESTIDALTTAINTKTAVTLPPVSQLKDSPLSLPEEEKTADLTEDIRKFRSEPDLRGLSTLKESAIFIPGIYTVAPLSNADIMMEQKSTVPLHSSVSSSVTTLAALGERPADESKILDTLLHRPSNVLCFGLIRRHKGFDEAIKLTRELSKRFKVIIAGKVMGSSFLYFREIVTKACSNSPKTKENCELEFGEIFRKKLKEFQDKGEIGASVIKTNGEREPLTALKDINETVFIKGGKNALNQFCAEILGEMPSYQALIAGEHQIEIHINPTEDELKKIAMQCRYAIKLDHKGMAHNASSIVSCLGFYLPTFTLCGLTTDSCFKSGGRYSDTIIMPAEEYVIHEGREVRPKIPDDYIFSIARCVATETADTYRSRLTCLRLMYEDGIFKPEDVSIQLMTKILKPLCSIEMPSLSSSVSEEKTP